jgi:hypothetical protein
MKAYPEELLNIAKAESLEAGTQIDLYRAVLDRMGLSPQAFQSAASPKVGFTQDQMTQDPFQPMSPYQSGPGGLK